MSVFPAAAVAAGASTRGVDISHCSMTLQSATGGHAAGGRALAFACAQCGGQLDCGALSEGDQGQLHQRVTCESCNADGLLSTNMPGRRHVVRRGRALDGGDGR